ncbi:hypothetical protein QF042_003758 [Pedobacter sp. W3I1]|uniref:hypothetical protein n=1 Tax=Pedobacter sp. W3I1 TaxID=3042291 RepID=UPI0027809E04|nr:hypothetical protein [Pedobacter sp. W3I1]MDQ0640193.1 hypothetical protein [Pedobacter sp. W3I1]
MKFKRSIFNHLSVKIAILSLFLPISTYAQEQKDLGVGTFTLQYFYYPNHVFSNDSTNNILLKRIYHIKHHRVIIKTIGPLETIQKDTVEVSSEDKDMEVKSKMEAKALYPIYLADYKNKDYFMFFEHTKKTFYYRDSLKNHPEDLYSPKASNIVKPIIINIKGGEINIAGKRCLTALAVTGTDTTKFYYTEEKLKFVSPLNIIPGVKNPILGIQTLQKDGRAFGLFIINIKDEELPNDTFTVPSTARLKTWDEVMYLSKTPN